MREKITTQKYVPSKDELRTEKRITEKITEEFHLKNPEFYWISDDDFKGKHYEDLSANRVTRLHIREDRKDVCTISIFAERGLFVSYKRKGKEYFVSTMKQRVQNTAKPLEKGQWKTETFVKEEKEPAWATELLEGTYRSAARIQQLKNLRQMEIQEERQKKAARQKEEQFILENELWHRAKEEYGEDLTYLSHY